MNLNKTNKKISLVADIGGTNIRITQTNKDNIMVEVETYQCAYFNSLYEVLVLYINKKKLGPLCINIFLAITCPVDGDWISMINLPQQFCQQELQ